MNRSQKLDLMPLEDRITPATFTVDSLADDNGAGTTLREAIVLANAAVGADDILFAPALNGTIPLTMGQLQITDDVTITGPGANLLTIDAQQTSRVFDITNAVANVTFAGLTITRGKTAAFGEGGGIRSFHTGTLTLTNSTVSGNTTDTGFGGGIYALTGAVVVANSTINGNSTTGSSLSGGGIFTFSSNLALTNSTVSGNSTTGTNSTGGGLATFSGNVTLTNSTILQQQ